MTLSLALLSYGLHDRYEELQEVCKCCCNDDTHQCGAGVREKLVRIESCHGDRHIEIACNHDFIEECHPVLRAINHGPAIDD